MTTQNENEPLAPETILVADPQTVARVEHFEASMAEASDPIAREFAQEILDGKLKLPTEYLTLAGLSRRLDLPIPRVAKLVHEGAIEADGKLGKDFLFLPSRVPELAQRFAPSKGGE